MAEISGVGAPPAEEYSVFRKLNSDEDRQAYNEQAERRRVENRRSSFLVIGRDADGHVLPPADQAEETRLATADLRTPLREAIAERDRAAERLAFQQTAAERARQHLDTVTAEVARLEDAAVEAARLAALQLAEQLRSGPAETVAIDAPAPAKLDHARQAMTVAQRAFEALRAEVVAMQRQVSAAQLEVGRCGLDVVGAELLRQALETAAHDRAAAQGRANLDAAGTLLAAAARRHGWRPARVFTTTVRDAMYYRPPDRPLSATIGWAEWINRLFVDAEAQLE
jgi:hypothetical protein